MVADLTMRMNVSSQSTRVCLFEQLNTMHALYRSKDQSEHILFSIRASDIWGTKCHVLFSIRAPMAIFQLSSFNSPMGFIDRGNMEVDVMVYRLKILWGLIISCWVRVVFWGEWGRIYGEDGGFIYDVVEGDEVTVYDGGVVGGVVDGDEMMVGEV